MGEVNFGFQKQERVRYGAILLHGGKIALQLIQCQKAVGSKKKKGKKIHQGLTFPKEHPSHTEITRFFDKSGKDKELERIVMLKGAQSIKESALRG